MLPHSHKRYLICDKIQNHAQLLSASNQVNTLCQVGYFPKTLMIRKLKLTIILRTITSKGKVLTFSTILFQILLSSFAPKSLFVTLFKSVITQSSLLYLGIPIALFTIGFTLKTFFISLWLSFHILCPNLPVLNMRHYSIILS